MYDWNKKVSFIRRPCETVSIVCTWYFIVGEATTVSWYNVYWSECRVTLLFGWSTCCALLSKYHTMINFIKAHEGMEDTWMGSELKYIRKCQNFWKHDLVHEYDCQYDVGSWDWIVDHFKCVKGEQIDCCEGCCLYFTKLISGKNKHDSICTCFMRRKKVNWGNSTTLLWGRRRWWRMECGG